MQFYELQKYGLGKYLLDIILSDIKSLHNYCGIHIKIKNYHKLLSKKFPYSIYYKYEESTISVYAVLDCRSNPIELDYKLK